VSKIKVLVVFANPRNTNPLRLGTEDRAIQQAIRRSRYRDNIELTKCHATTIHDVRQSLLDETFQIVHISGHGINNGLILEDDLGSEKIIPQKAIEKSAAKETVSEAKKTVLQAEVWKESKLSLSYMARRTFSSGIH